MKKKIIHSKLQDNPKVETTSIGEEPHRKVVISLKKNKKIGGGQKVGFTV